MVEMVKFLGCSDSCHSCVMCNGTVQVSGYCLGGERSDVVHKEFPDNCMLYHLGVYKISMPLNPPKKKPYDIRFRVSGQFLELRSAQLSGETQKVYGGRAEVYDIVLTTAVPHAITDVTSLVHALLRVNVFLTCAFTGSAANFSERVRRIVGYDSE